VTKTVFVDANVFLRFFTMDDEGQGEMAEALFRKAAKGEVRLIVGPPVLFEVAWTLKSAYRVSREQIIDTILRIIGMDGLSVTDGDIALNALNLAASTGQDFADAYMASTANSHKAEVATFNTKHFDRLGVHLYKMQDL
jgi:predicted nucleic acid-binding protein